MTVESFFKPFEKIAGYKALFWGLLGIAISTTLMYYSGYHYHGLLSIGPAPNNALWVHAVESLAIWVIPSIMFWIGGVCLSKSRVRPVDVFGTVAFAQLPLLLMHGFEFLPPFQRLLLATSNMSLKEVIQLFSSSTNLIFFLVCALFIICILIWMLIWLFNALKVSCNLKGTRLGICYAVAILISDVVYGILRILILTY